MAASDILKIRSDNHNSVAIAHIHTKFGSERKTDAPETKNTFKFYFCKNPRWRLAAILHILKWPQLCYRPAIDAIFHWLFSIT